jgi:hypothetical protein
MAINGKDAINISGLLDGAKPISRTSASGKNQVRPSLKIQVALSNDELFELTAALTSYIERQDRSAAAI